MSVPAGPSPSGTPSSRGARPAQKPSVRPAPSAHATQLRENLQHVLSGLRFPARRWEVIAEADAWGAGGPLRQAIARLPDGSYPSLAVVVDVLTGPAGRPGPAPGHAPARVVVPMRAPANGPRRPQ
ncbi:MAG: DUF2795 domain-containing protein [Actinomycetota bacterium]|nr:DUF2795 domain-containing protein [Actinomycetota bacterium]